VHEIPGNHDPLDGFQKHIRQEIDTVVEHEWLRILMINNARRDSHFGFITAEQIEWLTKQCELAAQKDQLILFAMHVPVHTNQKPDRGWYVKPENGQESFYELMKKHEKQVIALFHGHFHYGLRGWDDHRPVHEVSFPSALWNADPHLDQTALNGYHPIEFRPGFTCVKIRNNAIELRFHNVTDGVLIKKDLPLLKE
jgi:3',5'-cyclic AMP phosphodiesterase CpdA